MIPTEPNVLYASAEKVKNGAYATVVFTHDDGSQSTASFLSREFAKNNLNSTVAIIGNKIDEGEDDDAISSWASILDDANVRINFASHSYYHEYMGKTDEANTMYFNGVAREYPAGYITKTVASERARINGLFPNERMLAFVKPGVTKPDGESSQLSSETRAMIREHYIAMRDTDSVIDTYPPADFYQVRSMMAKQSSCGLTEWNNAINQVINKKGLLVFLFHNITSTSSSDDKVAMQSDVSVMCENLGEQVASGKIWSAKFDEAMQYAKEYQSITSVKSTFDPTTEEVYVSVTDSVSKIDPDLKTGKFAGRDMYDYPITVKTEIPYDWDYVKLTQSYDNRTEIVKTFVESGVRYTYANVVPDQESAVLTEATPTDYIGSISTGGVKIPGFDPATFYYKVTLSTGTTTAPTVTCNQSSASITQATLDNGEGSAIVKYKGLIYEIHFSVK